MAKTFNPQQFLARLDPSLAATYYQKQKDLRLTFDVDPTWTKKEAGEANSDFLQSLTDEQREIAESDFRIVNELKSYAGADMIYQKAQQLNLELPDDFDQYSLQDKALWFYLKYPDEFISTTDEYELHDGSGWAEVYIDNKPGNNIEDKGSALARAVSTFYWDHFNKGKYCIPRLYKYDGKISYILYPQDHARTDVTYSGPDSLDDIRRTIPVMKVYFTYDPKYSVLSVRAKGGKPVKKRLQKIFAETVLQQPESSIAGRMYDLNLLKEKDFAFDYDPTEIETVKVKATGLKAYDDSFRATLRFGRDTLGGTEDMMQTLQNLNNPQHNAYISQAVIYIKFKRKPKGSRGTVTVTLTFPQSHNLAETKLHYRVKELLREWSLARPHDDAYFIEYTSQAVSS